MNTIITHRLPLAASIEITVRQAIETPDLSSLLPQGVRVYLPDIDVDGESDLVRAAKRLHDIGCVAVPHFAARRFKTREALQTRLKKLSQEAGVKDVLLIGGDIGKPLGDFSSSLEVLETGLFDQYGIDDIGIAGHPEGVAYMPDSFALDVIKLKVEFCERSDKRLRIVTQFGFDPAAFITWADGLRKHEIDVPVHLGVVGPAKITTLVKYAAACGVGNSLNFIKKRAGSVASLLRGFSPDEIVEPIENHVRAHPDSAIEQIHIFTFGGLKQTSNWLTSRRTWNLQSSDDARLTSGEKSRTPFNTTH